MCELENLNSYHLPVLCTEAVQALLTNPNGVYVDVTMGGAGHTKAILRALGPRGRLFCFDRDPDAVTNAPKDERCTFIAANFRHIAQWMEYYGIEHVDGILADLGVSSHHFDTANRGFSFRHEEALPDMRMNNRSGITAADVLNTYTEEALADLFYYYGELRDARKIASLIVGKASECRRYTRLSEVIERIEATLPPVAQLRRRKLSQLFQALRIEVNDELGALRVLLSSSERLLTPSGHLVILTYHSLEDRIVKEWAKGKDKHTDDSGYQSIYGKPKNSIEMLTKKPVLPSEEEIEQNSRARSAKMRAYRIT